MHCLEVIVARNERAAGREAAHAENDGNERLAENIIEAADVTDAFVQGFGVGSEEN